MDLSVPGIGSMRPSELAKYVTDELIYVDYYPATERTGDLPIGSFGYLGWDGKPHTMPSVTKPVSFNYLKNGIYFNGTVDPVKREFIASELRNAGQSSQYVKTSTRGPFIEVENPGLGLVNIAFYEQPKPMTLSEPPGSRTESVAGSGVGVLLSPWTFAIIMVMLFLVIAMLGRSEEIDFGYRDPLELYV